MIVRRYDHKDYPTFKAWSKAWGIPVEPQLLLPEFGVVVDEQLMGFLMETETTLGIMLSVVSDPKASRHAIYKAGEFLADALVGRAEVRGCQRVLAWTKHPAVIKVLTDKGLSPMGMDLLALELK